MNSTKTFYSRSFKRYVTRKEVLAIDVEYTACYERVHEIIEAIKARVYRIREIYRYGY